MTVLTIEDVACDLFVAACRHVDGVIAEQKKQAKAAQKRG